MLIRVSWTLNERAPVLLKLTALTNVLVPLSGRVNAIGPPDPGNRAPVSLEEENIMEPVYPKIVMFELSFACTVIVKACPEYAVDGEVIEK